MTYPCLRDNLLLPLPFILIVCSAWLCGFQKLGTDAFDPGVGVGSVEAIRVDRREVYLHHVVEEQGNGRIDSVGHHIVTIGLSLRLRG